MRSYPQAIALACHARERRDVLRIGRAMMVIAAAGTAPYTPVETTP